ncbi:alpha/beta hydrolase [Sphingomonas sp.]|jgi:acetyl esterase/lipase|uniref:alpha/beta hydrolase n=1 Tax=Sphingomonas sp. TaxID=28214 RepID=UPI002DF40173|nr:alpha/beta hydrolase [Sphingomonas sp.]
MKLALLQRAAPLLGLVAAACSPLSAFNSVMPKDAGGKLTAAGLAYGEGPRRRLDVYVPRKIGDSPHFLRPVIVFFYGGSWNSGDRRGYSFVGRALAARGFVTVIPDYRLVPEVTYPGFVEDGAAAVRWVRAHAKDYGGDGERIVLAGHSAGAYIAAMLAVDTRWLGADRKAVRGLAGLAGPYDFVPFTVGASQAAFGRWPDAAETQPVTHADATAPPALLLTGAGDTTVKPRNSEALAAKLRAAGVSAEVKRYPDVAHIGILTAIAKPFRGKAPVVADVATFAERVTQ